VKFARSRRQEGSLPRVPIENDVEHVVLVGEVVDAWLVVDVSERPDLIAQTGQKRILR
jgi:hypothetical protein